jgi:hypothetical protein
MQSEGLEGDLFRVYLSWLGLVKMKKKKMKKSSMRQVYMASVANHVAKVKLI